MVVVGETLGRAPRRPKFDGPSAATIGQILAWADEHKAATGDWPNQISGQMTGTDETWGAINVSLSVGNRGLPSGGSLAKLLAEHRGVRNIRIYLR